MILTLTLNPCIDKTIYLDKLEMGAYNRIRSTRVDTAGKGIHVSTVLTQLKEKTFCMGFNFRDNGRLLEQMLRERGLPYNFIPSDGEIRTNIKLFDLSSQEMTEINEAGSRVSSSAVDRLVDEVGAMLEHVHILVLSGSLPPGVPTDIYQRLIRMAHAKHVKTVLDGSGEAFLLGLQEKPFLIKPNSMEFDQAFKHQLKAGKSPLEIAREVVESGVSYVCISMGENGAILVDKEHAYSARPLPLEAKGLTGAGDSMIAGMCYAIRKDLSTADMLRYASAAAGGSVRREGTLLARAADIEELLPQVEIDVLA